MGSIISDKSNFIIVGSTNQNNLDSFHRKKYGKENDNIYINCDFNKSSFDFNEFRLNCEKLRPKLKKIYLIDKSSGVDNVFKNNGTVPNRYLDKKKTAKTSKNQEKLTKIQEKITFFLLFDKNKKRLPEKKIHSQFLFHTRLALAN